MNLKKALTKELILLNMEAQTKTEVIETMLDHLVANGRVSDRAMALAALLERESKMSTGMQNGIAVPHAKTDCVDALATVIAIAREPIDFAAMDGKPCSIFIMTLSPVNRAGPHIQFLAEVARALSQAEVRERILKATSEQALLDILLEG